MLANAVPLSFLLACHTCAHQISIQTLAGQLLSFPVFTAESEDPGHFGTNLFTGEHCGYLAGSADIDNRPSIDPQ